MAERSYIEQIKVVGEDLVESVRLGLLPRSQLNSAKRNRERIKAALVQFLRKEGFLKIARPALRDVVPAVIAWLTASPAEIALINLEDLWLETKPQNVPGTSSERPNWRRKSKMSLEQIIERKILTNSKRISESRTR